MKKNKNLILQDDESYKSIANEILKSKTQPPSHHSQCHLSNTMQRCNATYCGQTRRPLHLRLSEKRFTSYLNHCYPPTYNTLQQFHITFNNRPHHRSSPSHSFITHKIQSKISLNTLPLISFSLKLHSTLTIKNPIKNHLDRDSHIHLNDLLFYVNDCVVYNLIRYPILILKHLSHLIQMSHSIFIFLITSIRYHIIGDLISPSIIHIYDYHPSPLYLVLLNTMHLNSPTIKNMSISHSPADDGITNSSESSCYAYIYIFCLPSCINLSNIN